MVAQVSLSFLSSHHLWMQLPFQQIRVGKVDADLI